MFPPESTENTCLNYRPQILLFINQQSIVLGAVMMLGAMRQVLTAAATSANFAQQGPDISNKSAARVTISWKQNLNIIHWVSAVLDIETNRRR